MKSFDNTFSFVRILAGKHAGEYGYIEDTFGKKIGVVSGKPNGDRFECLVSPADVERNLTKDEMRIAKECALNFYQHDIASKMDYMATCENESEKESVANIIAMRHNKMTNVKTIVL